MKFKYLTGLLITLFLYTVKANADEVEIGSCWFTAPDEAFAKEFNEQAKDELACDEKNSCLLTYVLHPGKYLLTNIGNDRDSEKAVMDPFTEARKIGNYIISIPKEQVHTPSKRSKVVVGAIKSDVHAKPIKIECRVCQVKRDPGTSISGHNPTNTSGNTESDNNANSSDSEIIKNLGYLTKTCQWR
ncbi:MAG: hypothetical protein K0R14_40 [Burkholderiales bacterium]|jgi:hypothetical protein|nr:hypothetical protein [Burkholderiales bacterium]